MAKHSAAYDVKYKVLLVGDSGVGKTALIRSLDGRPFKGNLRATVGVDFIEKGFEVDGSQTQLQIWDTAGQERFRTITKFQYRGTKGLLLVYDVTSRSSFTMVNYWLDSIDAEIDKDSKEPVPVFIVGNKCDLVDKRVVSTAQGRKLAESSYVHGFIETSAKNGVNVLQAFQRLARAVTEIYHPKMMNSYLTREEREERVRQRMYKLFSAGSSQMAPTCTIKNSTNYNIVDLRTSCLQSAVTDSRKTKNCACG